MGCINRNNPEIQQLLKESNLTPLAFEIKLDKWFQETQSDRLPTIEQLTNSLNDQLQNSEGIIASEKTLRDLAARMSDRIGIPVRFESDRTKEYKGKLENGIAYVNLAYATLDTPIHEILGHPIIRAIKNIEDSKVRYFLDNEGVYKNGNKWYHLSNNKGGGIVLDSIEEVNKFLAKENTTTLYQNLLKELEYGKGKEVLDRVKRNYVYKHKEPTQQEIEIATKIAETFKKLGKPLDASTDRILNRPKYTLEEQQEEAIVELLGLMTADKLNAVKDGKLISLLKRLLKEIKAFVRDLLKQREVEIDKLPNNMTLGDIAHLLAYSNSKLILPGNEVIYTTPDNQQFKTYTEASKHISDLSNSVEDINLNDISINRKLNKEEEEKAQNYRRLIKETNLYFASDAYKKYKEERLNDLNEELTKLQNKPPVFNTQEPYLKQEDIIKYGFSDYDYVRVESSYSRPPLYNTPIWETYFGKDFEGYYIHGYNTVKGKDSNKVLKITKEEAEAIWKKEIELDPTYGLEIEDRRKINDLKDAISSLKNDEDIKYQLSTLQKSLEELTAGNISGFIKKNKEYEQSKEIIEEWKKINDIQYNPEEIYSRGQEFVSVVGAYSKFDVNLMMQNLLQHIEDNEKAGGKFAISAFTKPVDKTIGHLEGGGGKIKFKIYPQSKDILWAADTDVFSGSVWDASEKVNKDKKSELLGVSYTKYPSLNNIISVKPNLANIIDDLAHHHNELGISLTGNNFRLEYDEDIPYSTKKIIDSINSILDQKYGELVKPEINRENLNATKLLELRSKLQKLQEKEEELYATSDYESIDGVYAEKLRNEITNINQQIQNLKNSKNIGIQPTQTNETLKESIDSIANKLDREIIEKEYTSQALINTKISKLKEVAKKYPRSLIRSEVKPIENLTKKIVDGTYDLPFQLIPGNQKKIDPILEAENILTRLEENKGNSESFELSKKCR